MYKEEVVCLEIHTQNTKKSKHRLEILDFKTGCT